MYLIDRTSGSGSSHEIFPGGGYKRFNKKFQPVNDTYGLFNITIQSAQSDDCFREFEILVNSPFNENDKRVTKLVILPCEPNFMKKYAYFNTSEKCKQEFFYIPSGP